MARPAGPSKLFPCLPCLAASLASLSLPATPQVQAQEAGAARSAGAASQLRCQHARRGAHAAGQPGRHLANQPHGGMTR